jgi:hypothetical protein
MPIYRCRRNGKSGFKYGVEGKCYTYTDPASKKRAHSRAVKQGQAIEKSKGNW